MADIFISYSRQDKPAAIEIGQWLRGQGFQSIFLDIDTESGIPPGSEWERVLYRKIESAQAMLLIITRAWDESKWCFVEFAQARALGKAIFPIVVAPEGERYVPQDIQHLDIQLDREAGLTLLARKLKEIAMNAQEGFPWPQGRSPYPGLTSFNEEDAAVFFGRDDEIRSLIEQTASMRTLGNTGLLVVLGASGSGKSSVLRAGVLPRLNREKRDWLVLPPIRPGRDPIGELALAAGKVLREPPDRWREALLLGTDGFVKMIEALRLSAESIEAYILITIDQGEELLLRTKNERERLAKEQFFNLISQIRERDMPCIVLLALRSDFLGRLQEALHSETSDIAIYPLGPFPRNRVAQIIRGPAKVAGIRVEDELVDAVLTDMGAQDALPLLAFTLSKLYDVSAHADPSVRGGIELSLARYQSLGNRKAGISPLENVVRNSADKLIQGKGEEEKGKKLDDQHRELKEAFIAMTRIDDEGGYARQPAIWNELPQASRSVLEKFAEARLVIISEEAGVRTVEVAHEALLRKWPTLSNWLDEERDFLTGRKRLQYAVEQWTQAKESHADLLHGRQLLQARQWLTDHPERFNSNETRFIEASIRQEERGEIHATRLRRWTWAAIAGLATLMLFVAFLTRERRTAIAEADAASLAVQANLTAAYDPLGAVALASRAVARHPSISANSALLQSILAVSPNLAKVWTLGNLHPTALAVDPEAGILATAGEGGIMTWHGFDVGASAPSHARLGMAATAAEVRSGMLAVALIGHDPAGVREDGMLASTDAGTQNTRVVKLLSTVRLTVAAIARSGRMIVADSTDKSVHFFDCTDALKEKRTSCEGLVIGAGFPTALAIDDQRHRAAIGYENGELQLVTLPGAAFGPRPSAPQPLPPLPSRITALRWSPDGDSLAAGTLDGRTVILDANGSAQSAIAAQHAVTALSWDRTGSELASSCGSTSLCVWRVAGRPRTFSTLLARLSGHTDVVRSIEFSGDGRTLVSVADDDTARLWSLNALDADFAQLPAGRNNAMTALGLSSDHQWLAAGDDSGHIYVWSLQNQRLASSFSALDQQIDSVAWSPDGERLGVGGVSGAVTIVDPSGSKSIGDPPPWSSPVTGIAWLPDNSGILASGESDGSIHSLSTNGAVDRVVVSTKEGVVLGLTVDPRLQELFATDDQGKMWSWKLPDGSSPHSVDTGASRDTIMLASDDRRLVVAGNDGNALVFKREDASNPVICRTGERQLDGAAFSSEGSILAAISSDATLYVWHVSSRCDLLASASMPALLVGQERAAHRPRLISLPGLNAFAVINSSSRVLLFPAEPTRWLARAKEITALTEGAYAQAQTH